jgi:hypothetical protein
MATFDDTARQACKVSGVGLIPWLGRFATEPMAADFASWDDTRRTSWPGGPERTDDVVCVLRRRADGGPAHLIVEVATEPRADDLARLGVYELLLAIEVRAVLEEGPPVYGAIIHLTGSRKGGPLRLTRSATAPGVLVQPIEVWLADESAVDTLALLESVEVERCILPWIVLMRDGDEPAAIERWKRLAEGETDVEKRAAYRHFALEFAELIPGLVNWQRLLEGWEVRESQYSKTIEARGEHRGKVKQAQADLLDGLGRKLQSAVPEPIRLAVEGTNDLDTLKRWFGILFTVDNWAEFEAKMKQP